MGKLMFALRLKPYAYFGGPAFLACIVLLAVGLSLQVAQKTLLNSGKVPVVFASHAAILWFTTFATLLVILEKANWVYIIFMSAQTSFVLWVVHMNWEEIAGARHTRRRLHRQRPCDYRLHGF